ncbi:alpha/beta fold hydrolase [Occultella aeris]|uniref:alpha/beta fold hydrolase n=1 Tax=Occultella aeris TaxID=2761496 RepID=UPI001E441231|nr:alpha/beta fold hydrolase [Occultella aeris]
MALLRADGYTVVAPANPLRGLHAAAEYLRTFLDSIDGPVVIAGHSYGGTVMSEAADGPEGRTVRRRRRSDSSSPTRWRTRPRARPGRPFRPGTS